jgi:hypothetical protein
LVIILVIALFGGFSGRFRGYGYGHGGIGVLGVVLIIVIVLLPTGLGGALVRFPCRRNGSAG